VLIRIRATSARPGAFGHDRSVRSFRSVSRKLAAVSCLGWLAFGCSGNDSPGVAVPDGEFLGHVVKTEHNLPTVWASTCPTTLDGRPMPEGPLRLPLRATEVGVESNPIDPSLGHIQYVAFADMLEPLSTEDWIVTVENGEITDVISASAPRGPDDACFGQ
jgi:hypothetical protein